MSDLIERLKAELAAVQDNRWGAAPVSITQHEAREIITALTPQSEEEQERLASACAELADLIVNDDKLVNSSPVVASATVQLLRQAAAALRQPAPPTWTRVEDGLAPSDTLCAIEALDQYDDMPAVRIGERCSVAGWQDRHGSNLHGVVSWYVLPPITPPEGES